MTNKEAINILKYDRDYLYTNNRGNDKPCYNEEAYKLAIKALEERPKGEWIESPYEELRKHGYFKCSNCGVGFKRFDKEYQCYDNFCPNCGANMVADLCSICKHGDNCERSDKGVSFAKHSVCWKYER